jgi:hypothetical protein
MKTMDDSADQSYLTRFCERIFALDRELSQVEGDSAAYLDTWKRLHEMKERYKQRTGIYPQLPAKLPSASDEGAR